MTIPSPHRFSHPGPAEYILLKAGLFQADDKAVSPTDKLLRLLRPLKDVPEELLPVLVRMAEMSALDLSGAIDTSDRRSGIMRELLSLGLRNEGIGGLFAAVGKGAELAAEERRNRPRTEELYM